MSNKILVNCAHGADNIEKATVAFIVASASAASDNETAMFLTGEAVRLATNGGADGHQAEGYQPVKEFLDATIENGGSVGLPGLRQRSRDRRGRSDRWRRDRRGRTDHWFPQRRW